MNETILYIVIGLFFLSIIGIGLAYKKGYIPNTKQWGLKKLEEIKKQKFEGYTKLGDKPDNNSFCCLTEDSDPELQVFCEKYKIPTENETGRCTNLGTLSDTFKHQDANLIYNNNAFKLFILPDGKRIIKNLSILSGLKEKLKKLEGVIDSIELEVTFRMIDIQLSNDDHYTHISKPVVTI